MKTLMDKTKKGFTIIEVVLVLAIAGLIFIMVFIALPALQRSQRDTQRKRNIQLVSAALESYKSNNKGRYPWIGKTAGANDAFVNLSTEAQDFFNSYVNKEGNVIDPSHGDYNIRITAYNSNYSPTGASGTASGFPIAPNFIYITGSAKCENGGVHHEKSQVQIQYTIQYRLEASGVQCQTFN